MKIWDFIFCEHTYVVNRSKDTLEATEMDMGIDLDTTHTHMFTIDNHICLKPGQNYCANSIKYCFIWDQQKDLRFLDFGTCTKRTYLLTLKQI